MRLVKGGLVGRFAAILLLGNGTRDERIIGEVMSKFNHKKTILLPTIPRRTGIEAIIDQLTILSTTTRVNTYIVVLDKEHLRSVKEVESSLKRHGFSISRIEDLGSDALVIECVRGGRKVVVYVALVGLSDRGCIEECLAGLIKLIYGEDVEPTKESLSKWLSSHDMSDRDIVSRASKEQLRRVFPGLLRVIEVLTGN